MRVGIVQSTSKKGDVSLNIENHLSLIKRALAFKPDLIVFPELSITGYEPEWAEKLASTITNKRFNPFQILSNSNKVTLSIGMPLRAKNGVHISMFLFQPHKEPSVYSKQILHEDELPYFVSGKGQVVLTIKEKKIAFGICYETLQREHFLNAVANNADIYIASVAKPERGTRTTHLHFPTMAKEFHIPVLMSNCVGFCDNFLSNGKSAVWNDKGELIAQLDGQNQGILCYDTELDEVTVLQNLKLIN